MDAVAPQWQANTAACPAVSQATPAAAPLSQPDRVHHLSGWLSTTIEHILVAPGSQLPLRPRLRAWCCAPA